MSFSQLRIAAGSQGLVSQLVGRATSSNKAPLERLLEAAASTDNNAYLSEREVAEVLALLPGTAPLTDSLVEQASVSLLPKFIEGRTNAASRGMSVHFQAGKLEQELIDELHAVVAHANGRQLDINMMIFEFQSDAIEAAIADIARANRNVTFRIIGDSTQASSGGGNALPALMKLRLPNIVCKFKKDFPYSWNPDKKMPVYNHGASTGLNHHKGFVAVIDGVPERLVSGSFNWSQTANEKNYEDLAVLHALDPSLQQTIALYQDEFVGFFNNGEATLSERELAAFKREKWNELLVKNGEKPLSPIVVSAADRLAPYQPATGTPTLNVNHSSSDASLQALLSAATGSDAMFSSLKADRDAFGRFSSFEDLSARVQGIAALASPAAASLRGATFGVVDSSRQVDVRFNSRAYGAASAGTGYGALTSQRQIDVNDGATQSTVGAGVSSVVQQMLAPLGAGDSLDVALYAASPSSKETKAVLSAAQRGVKIRVVLNDDHNENVAKALAQAGIEVRMQKARTMHEKFAVTGNGSATDAALFGSANFSESSSTKHSEDRFLVQNDAAVAGAFRERFSLLWEKSRPLV